MANGSSIVFAGIAPHPPIMVPEVGRDAIADVRTSIDAMSDLTGRVIRSGAETIVIISPHAPRPLLPTMVPTFRPTLPTFARLPPARGPISTMNC